MYTMTLELGDKVYKSKGDTPADALINMERPRKISSKGILTVKNGKKETRRLFYPARLKRLFFHPSFQRIIAKQLVFGMK